MAAFSARKASGPTHEEICRDIRAGNVKPIYYLMGEESYYIDRLADFITDTLLKPDERDFNLLTLYGADTDAAGIILAARGYPMGAQRLIVVVREAQNLRDVDRLELYLRQPQPSTVLVLCHKNGTLDRRKKLAGLIEKAGVLYESKKMKDAALPTFITNYLRRRQLAIEPAAAQLLAEYVGSDLNRLASELDKLVIACSSGQVAASSGQSAAFSGQGAASSEQGAASSGQSTAPSGQSAVSLRQTTGSSNQTVVSPELIERHIGISKEFNIFELQDALGQKDALRVSCIANYFDKNQKENPPQKILPALFRYFSNLMLAYYAPEKTERGIAAWLGVGEWQVRKNVLPAMQHYSGVKVMKIIGEIRRTDARSKGVGNPNIPAGELMKELYFFILH